MLFKSTERPTRRSREGKNMRVQVQVFDLYGRVRRVRRFSIGRDGIVVRFFGRLYCFWFRKAGAWSMRTPRQIAQRIDGGYVQDRDGKWWILNPQRGWVRVDTNGRAFKWYLTRHTKLRLKRPE